jgi:hypothetical protein
MDHHHFELLVKKGVDNVSIAVLVVVMVADWQYLCCIVVTPYHTSEDGRIFYHTIPYHIIYQIIYHTIPYHTIPYT